MSALDVFVFLLLVGGAAVGFVRGFVHEVISLLAWAVAILMLKLFHTQLWTGLETSFDTSPPASAVLAFAFLFLPSFLLVKLLARSLGGRTRRSRVLGPFDGQQAVAPLIDAVDYAACLQLKGVVAGGRQSEGALRTGGK